MSTKVSDARISYDGKLEMSSVLFKVVHPEWTLIHPTGLLYLSHIVDISARCAADGHTPRHPGITIVGPTTDREWEYDRALHESQTAAVRRLAVPSGWASDLGAMSTMLGRSLDVLDSHQIFHQF